MKITRFPQSCFLVEAGSKRILIDPGYINFDDSFFELWKNIDAVLITHKHGDHCSQEIIEKVSPKEIYSSQEVANAYPEMKIQVVKEADIIVLDEVSISVVHAQHGYIPLLKNGKEIFENIGYIIEVGGKKLYHVGDSISFHNDYKCDVILVPVCNHGLVMGPFEAAEFAKETGASLVIPMHYDNASYPADMEKVKEEFEKHGLNYQILNLKEIVEL
jgi:L-ascorbate metabolism protein UlaG (beta-lactamase superfamily)